MLTWESLDILSYGAGTPSTALALMSCENAMRGRPYPYPKVPVYDAVIFCDLHSEPSWVYEQAEFAASVCTQVGIPYYRLDADLYGDFTRNFGRTRTACLPFWTLGEAGKKGRMPRQCTYDYKIKVLERFVRYELLCYRPKERTLSFDMSGKKSASYGPQNQSTLIAGKKRIRSTSVCVWLSPDEQAKIRERMAEVGIRNLSAYMRKMALNGYVLHVDLAPVKEIVFLQRRCANNLNQIAVQANTYGGVYPNEIKTLQKDYSDLWGLFSELLEKLSEVVAL